MPITTEKYTPDWHQKWNEFNNRSKNGSFLFDRNYMDYHSDRFQDNSLIAFNDKDEIIALLPACRKATTVFSHNGLTYGGWITSAKTMDAGKMLEVWQSMTETLRRDGITSLIYKPVPWIYPTVPSDDDLYAIFRNGGQLKSVLVSTAVNLEQPVGFNGSSRNRANRAARNGYTVARSHEFEQFWRILEFRLMTRHNARPVHTLAEITLLAERFPDNIELWCVYEPDGEIAGGTVIYRTTTVAHAQYTAATDHGLHHDSLPLLFQTLIRHYKENGQRYFDFGTSNEQDGTILNYGLIEQKQQFGGRSVAYCTFEIDI